MSSHRTEKRCAVVTGAARGIGKAIARKLLINKYKVILADADAQEGKATLQELASLGEVDFCETDVSQERSIQGLFEFAEKHWGELNLLVNNAAIAIPGNAPVEHLELAQWNRILSINLTGPLLCTKHAAHLLRKTQGSIVNIASTRALMSEPDTEGYVASKGGLVSLTHALAMSLGPQIRVNCISPGWIDTSAEQPKHLKPAPLRPEDHAQHPAGRVGVPDDVAALVLFLASDEAKFATGANFVLDGGMTRKMIYQE